MLPVMHPWFSHLLLMVQPSTPFLAPHGASREMILVPVHSTWLLIWVWVTFRNRVTILTPASSSPLSRVEGNMPWNLSIHAGLMALPLSTCTGHFKFRIRFLFLKPIIGQWLFVCVCLLRKPLDHSEFVFYAFETWSWFAARLCYLLGGWLWVCFLLFVWNWKLICCLFVFICWDKLKMIESVRFSLVFPKPWNWLAGCIFCMFVCWGRP